jgi:hypothetical protein
MYGISDLNLDEIVGSEIHLICSGRYDVQFHFGSGTRVMVQGDVTLFEGDKLVGSWNEENNWSSLAFQHLLNVTIKGYSVPNDRLLQIEFENSYVLKLHDSSDQYESFQIYKKDTNGIIVV